MAQFPTSVPTDADLKIAVNNLSTQLNGAIDASQTTITVDSASGFPTAGFITIDTEAIEYTGTTATTFTGCIRGSDGTAAASHTDNTQVYHNIVAAHHNALKDEIIAIAQNISDRFGLGSTDVKIPATNKLFLDGGTHTYIEESSNDVITMVRGGSTGLVLDGSFSVQAGGIVTAQGGLSLVGEIDALAMASNNTDATTKEAKVLLNHYTNAEEPVMGLYLIGTSSQNRILIGGGSASQNAATSIEFLTGATNTTTSGSARGLIDSSGNMVLGDTSATGRLDLVEKGNLNLSGAGTAPTEGNAGLRVRNSGDTIKILMDSNQIECIGNTLAINFNSTEDIALAQGGGDVYTAAWTDYAGSSTITGFSGTPTANIRYKQIGKLVFVSFRITGTSNATTTSFTLPFTSANTTVQFGGAMDIAQDNGTDITTATRFNLAGNSNTVNCYTDMVNGSWTASGGKQVQGHFWYEIA